MRHIGQYEVAGVIGDGGMGTVYRARDPRFDRTVAIKVLHQHFLRDAEVAERFRTEAVIQAKLNHPHIVTVYDFVTDETVLAMVMEYVEGEPLDEVIGREGRLGVRRSVGIAKQVLQALGHAHEKGLVHRDVKPSNIVVSEVGGEDYVKVMDFGIAKIVGSEKLRTATGAKMGTLAYMSPEQVRSPKHVDGRTDIYSVGVTLYEMLAGRVPYEGDSEYELMEQIVGRDVDVGVLEGLGVPWGMVQVVRRSLAKEVAERYESCEAFRRELEEALEQRAAVREAEPTTRVFRPPPSAREPHPNASPSEALLSRFRGQPIRLRMSWIPPGLFAMGSPLEEDGRDSDELAHLVQISRGFWFGSFEVSQREWEAVMGMNPSRFRGSTLPVEQVSWFDALRFCNALSTLRGLKSCYRVLGMSVMWDKAANGYRLPTEAEWEYACRAGTSTAFHTGWSLSTADANYDGRFSADHSPGGASCETTWEVGRGCGNAWGLHDMHGNVAEWCWDWYDAYAILHTGLMRDPEGPSRGALRVVRGGCWSAPGKYCRSAARSGCEPSACHVTQSGSVLHIGFRVVLCA